MGLHPVLFLAVGSRVMLTLNLCQSQGLTNGAFGWVRAIIYKEGEAPGNLPMFVVVEFDDYKKESCLHDVEHCVAVKPKLATWYVGRKRYSRKQLPLRLAWAITVHKSQGQTIRKLVLDIEKSHAAGLEFVGVSRVKRLSDLVIQPISWEKFRRLNNKQMVKMRKKEDARLRTLHANLMNRVSRRKGG